ncbi:hypothetical protein BH11PLA1_BH11PLA1_05510 [soil metagenome]
MRIAPALILVAFAAILVVPFWARRAERDTLTSVSDKTARHLIVVTPHVEQIRVEFARAFDAWHRNKFGEAVFVDYRAPGGTTEILKLLEATYSAAIQRHLAEIRAKEPLRLLDPALNFDGLAPGEADFDVMFGGGTFDHDRLRSRGVTVAAALPAEAATRQVVVQRPRDGVRAAGLGALRSLDAKITIEGAAGAITARIPAGAIEGGASALEPLTRDAQSVSVRVNLAQCERLFTTRISTPPNPLFTQAELEAVYGPKNVIGAGQLYQDNRTKENAADWQYWMGTALSGFGIVYNRPMLKELGIAEPTGWNDLRNPKLAGLVALADARLSGSVATLYDSILNSQGFEEGFRTLRDLCANARSFAAASTQPPMDVSQGDAAVGVAIDFYGRFQAQSVLQPGETAATGRVGYIDPPGAVYVDADPVSILRGAPDPGLARRFVEFCLTEEAQALWQFPARAALGVTARDGAGAAAPSTLGPKDFVLRRMPVRQSMYEPANFANFTDQVNLFEIASSVKTRGWRDGMIMMMGAFGIDTWSDLKQAWAALRRAEATPGFDAARLTAMRSAFYAMPTHTTSDGKVLAFTEANYSAIAADTGRFRDPDRGPAARIAFTKFFRAQYRKVVEMERGGVLETAGAGMP